MAAVAKGNRCDSATRHHGCLWAPGWRSACGRRELCSESKSMQAKVSGRGRLAYEDNHPADYRAFLKAAKQHRAAAATAATHHSAAWQPCVICRSPSAVLELGVCSGLSSRIVGLRNRAFLMGWLRASV